MNLYKPNYLSRTLSANNINKHIERGLDIFYNELKILCSKHRWRYDPPIKKRIGNFNRWKNNLVSIEQVEEYDDYRPKGFIVTYNIPSFIGLPINRDEQPDLNENQPSIGYKHKIYISLPYNYTTAQSIESSEKRSDAFYIESRSQLFHPKFLLRDKSWGKIEVRSGEMSKILMSLLFCLLWDSEYVWKGIEDNNEKFINQQALALSKKYGNEVYSFLLEKMTFQWGLNA